MMFVHFKSLNLLKIKIKISAIKKTKAWISVQLKKTSMIIKNIFTQRKKGYLKMHLTEEKRERSRFVQRCLERFGSVWAAKRKPDKRVCPESKTRLKALHKESGSWSKSPEASTDVPLAGAQSENISGTCSLWNTLKDRDSLIWCCNPVKKLFHEQKHPQKDQSRRGRQHFSTNQRSNEAAEEEKGRRSGQTFTLRTSLLLFEN